MKKKGVNPIFYIKNVNIDWLKLLPRNSIVKLTNLRNVSYPIYRTQIIWIQKTRQNTIRSLMVSTHILTASQSDIFQAKWLKPIRKKKKFMPSYQIGFRRQHLTLEQVPSSIDTREKALLNNLSWCG